MRNPGPPATGPNCAAGAGPWLCARVGESDGMLVGIVSIGDLVKALLADQEARLGKIEAYISGEYPA